MSTPHVVRRRLFGLLVALELTRLRRDPAILGLADLVALIFVLAATFAVLYASAAAVR